LSVDIIAVQLSILNNLLFLIADINLKKSTLIYCTKGFNCTNISTPRKSSTSSLVLYSRVKVMLNVSDNGRYSRDQGLIHLLTTLCMLGLK